MMGESSVCSQKLKQKLRRTTRFCVADHLTRRVVEHAGLSSRVRVVEGVLRTRIDEVKWLLATVGEASFDFVLIDHKKEFYLSDFSLLKTEGLITTGTVVFADNMRIPGAPEYKKYVLQSHKEEMDTVQYKTQFENISWLPDLVLVSTCK